jgi:hypothetical protein
MMTDKGTREGGCGLAGVFKDERPRGCSTGDPHAVRSPSVLADLIERGEHLSSSRRDGTSGGEGR